MNPFDLPGPRFLLLYLAGLAVALVVSGLLRFVCQQRARQRAAALPLPRLSLMESAMLLGGRQRALQTALTALGAAGAVTADAQGKLVAARAQVRHADPLAAELQAELAKRPRDWAGLSRRPHRALLALECRMRDAGMLMRPGSAEALCRRVTALPLLALFACGVAKLFIGVGRHRPVEFLLLLLFATGALWLYFFWTLPLRSAFGERVAEQLKRRNAALEAAVIRRGEMLAERDLLLAVALFGAVVLPASDLAWLRPLVVPPSSAPGDGGGGGSCGGGGGGGCGGCGS